MKSIIMLRLTPVESLLVRHCLRSYLNNNKTGENERKLARKIYDRIDDAYKE